MRTDPAVLPDATEVQPMERDDALSVFNAFLGVWLVGSSFLWPHSTANLVNSIAVGLACLAVALLSLGTPAARWLFVPLSAWMIASPWIVPLRDTMSAPNLIAMGSALFLGPLTMRYLGQDDPREVVRHVEGTL